MCNEVDVDDDDDDDDGFLAASALLSADDPGEAERMLPPGLSRPRLANCYDIIQ